MPFHLDKFTANGCTLVASTEATFKGSGKALEKFIKKSLKKRGYVGPVLIITGSHGGDEGDDGLNNILFLNSYNKKKIDGEWKLISEETRKFYEEWIIVFQAVQLEADDIDPRNYGNEEKTEVISIKDEKPPKWRKISKDVGGTTVEFMVSWALYFSTFFSYILL